MVTITHAAVTGNTAVILSSLSHVAQVSVNCHQTYQLEKGGQ